MDWKPQPDRMGHVALKVRDIHRSVAFYRDIVGLTVSDWIEDNIVFMRAGHRTRAGNEHHDLVLHQLRPGSDEYRNLEKYIEVVDHVAYRLAGVEEMEKAVRFLQEKGVEIVEGLGRHGPGENTFLVFKDPDGYNIEFYSDMRWISPEQPYTPSRWVRGMHSFDVWNLKKFVVEPPAFVKAWLKKKA
ncbi:MAG: VOC family protein [Nitrospinota bacterium]